MVFAELKSNKKRVLALEGAGFRSFSTLLVLDGIMRVVSQRARKPLAPSDVFDLICGTSGGGLVALLVGRLQLDCTTAIAVYKDLAKCISHGNESALLKAMFSSFETELDSTTFDDFLRAKIKEVSTHEDSSFLSSSQPIGIGSQTFVPVACTAPFSNRTYNIRSYPAQLTAPPLRHKWSVYEVARASVAARTILPPLALDQKFVFRDPAFAGFGTPISFVKREIDTLWRNAETSTVLCLGVDLQAFKPPVIRRNWTVDQSYLDSLIDQLLLRIQDPGERKDPNVRSSAGFILKQYMGTALETELAWSDAVTNGDFPSEVLTRLNAPSGLGQADLVDFFHLDQVEKSVTGWLTGDGKDDVFKLAMKIVDAGQEILDVDTARDLPPPLPPSTTNPGYHKSLDEPRPKTMMGYLQNYHVIFVVDDSRSMRGERWSQAQDALVEIAEYAKKFDCHEMDVIFLHDERVHQGVQGFETIRNLFSDVVLQGSTPTGACLETVIQDHFAKLESAVGTAVYGLIRPLDIIVLTDGVPSDNPNEVLANAVRYRNEHRHHPNAIGVQVVQIGDDRKAGPALQKLMYGNVQSMVDTFQYDERINRTSDGRLTPKELERILLGGLHPNVRALLPASKGGQA